MTYEIVIYKYGTSLYHKIGDGAQLRPNVEENGRYPFVMVKKTPPKVVYYLYAANCSKEGPISPIFPSNAKCEEWRKANNLIYGVEVYLAECVYDKIYDGHR